MSKDYQKHKFYEIITYTRLQGGKKFFLISVKILRTRKTKGKTDHTIKMYSFFLIYPLYYIRSTNRNQLI